jgi:hypothetical protein
MSNSAIPEVVNPSCTPPYQVAKTFVPSKGPYHESKNIISLWLELFYDILNDEHLTQKLRNTIIISMGVEGNVEGSIVVNLTEKDEGWIQRRKKRSGCEFILNSHIDGYEINDSMLYLDSDINILPKKMWEAMRKLRLVYSPFQLGMANQYCIYPVRRLENVEVNLVGFKIVTKFKVIEIMREKDPYPSLLGID